MKVEVCPNSKARRLFAYRLASVYCFRITDLWKNKFSDNQVAPKINKEQKMVGGVFALYNLYPFIVDIFIQLNKGSPQHICGGSLVTYNWVLTAAHCCKIKMNKNPITTLYLGMGHLDNIHTKLKTGTLKFQYGQTRRAMFIHVHENFDNKTLDNDIALIKTRIPFHKDKNVVIVNLPLKEEMVDLSELFRTCRVGGWGITGFNNIWYFNKTEKTWTIFNDPKHTRRLMHLVLPLISNYQCNRLYHYESNIAFNVNENQICTLYYPGRKAPCRGDSGGPLICGSFQYGIVSGSFSCGMPRLGADVYTRVDKYLNWINKTIDCFNKTNDKFTRRFDSNTLNMDYYYYDYDMRSQAIKFALRIIDYLIIIIILIFVS